MKPLPRNRSLIVWRKHYLERGFKKGVRTICEVLRELHADAEQRQDALSMQRLEEATDMAKRMQSRLKRYAIANKDPVYLTVDDVGEFLWLTKEAIKRG